MSQSKDFFFSDDRLFQLLQYVMKLREQYQIPNQALFGPGSITRVTFYQLKQLHIHPKLGVVDCNGLKKRAIGE